MPAVHQTPSGMLLVIRDAQYRTSAADSSCRAIAASDAFRPAADGQALEPGSAVPVSRFEAIPCSAAVSLTKLPISAHANGAPRIQWRLLQGAASLVDGIR